MKKSSSPKILITFISLVLSLSVFALAFVVCIYRTLPDVKGLLSVSYQEPMHILAEDNSLIAEYGEYKRIPIKYEDIPPSLIQAIISTEDQRFFHHNGIDPLGLMRAAIAVLKEGDKVQGASTITMQVARNFFLDKDKNFLRKFKEILLSFEIELYLSKPEILELYCNQIFFGRRSYGVEAAAMTYYGRSVDKLTVPELAMLAGIPQAPSRHNPLRNEKKSILRRNHVLERMLQQGYVTVQNYKDYISAPNTAAAQKIESRVDAMHVADLIRQYWVDKLGESAYTRGLVIRTTISPEHQRYAQKAIADGMRVKRGIPFEAPMRPGMTVEDVQAWLVEQKLPSKYEWGVVTRVHGKVIDVVTPTTSYQLSQSSIIGIEQIFAGAVVPIKEGKIRQWPLAEAALVNMRASSGGITAMIGGVDWRRSHFNRAVQSMRQPGSAFKPLLVASALRQGYRLSNLVIDEPFIAKVPGKDTYWQPKNHDEQFKGTMTLYDALVQSRNLVMVHLLSHMNIDDTLDLISQMGLTRSNQPRSLAMSLGAGVVNPVQMMTSFGIFMNQGMRVYPHLLLSVTDQHQKSLPIEFEEMGPGLYTRAPNLSDLVRLGLNPNVLTEEEAWSMWTVLKDVVKRGTARRALVLERSDIAGKTGTTNNQRDTWFVGMGGAYVSAVWCGYDQLKSLKAYGSNLSLPIWIEFMKPTLKGQSVHIVAKPKESELMVKTPEGTELWMDGNENDDWVDPDQEEVMREIL